MKTFEFTLRFSLADASENPDDHVEALYEAGCDDAVVGVGRRGHVALMFAREARSAFHAVTSAVRDVRKAIPGAVLVEASPDFVGLTDVADIAGFTRQNMRKLMLANPATFPPAVHEGSPALWHLASVLGWLQDQQRPVDATLLAVARATMKLNLAREARQLPGATLPKDLEPLFA